MTSVPMTRSLGDVEAQAERSRRCAGSASIAALQARWTTCAASGSQWTFHSVVGVVLPDAPNAPPM